MRSTVPGDEELILRIAGAEQDAVRVLYARYGRLVFSIALHVLGDEPAAEEVTQDVFLRVWEKAGTYDPGKSRPATWLSRIARNRAIDMLREARARGEHLKAVQDELSEDPGRGSPGPAESMELSGQREQVREAVAALPESQRRALTLAFFQGLTHREIAERLGEPLGTVKTRIREAMRRMREQLEQGGGP
jgi:RNA polymerase sigma-70 factor (ECF subfamily)